MKNMSNQGAARQAIAWICLLDDRSLAYEEARALAVVLFLKKQGFHADLMSGQVKISKSASLGASYILVDGVRFGVRGAEGDTDLVAEVCAAYDLPPPKSFSIDEVYREPHQPNFTMLASLMNATAQFEAHLHECLLDQLTPQAPCSDIRVPRL